MNNINQGRGTTCPRLSHQIKLIRSVKFCAQIYHELWRVYWKVKLNEISNQLRKYIMNLPKFIMSNSP